MTFSDRCALWVIAVSLNIIAFSLLHMAFPDGVPLT